MMTRRLLRAPLLLAIPLAFILGACSEDLETGGACPALCPGQQLNIRDTVLYPAIVLDTTLGVYPFIGFESALLLASRGDTLDVRGVVRFDTIVRGFKPTPADTVHDVVSVDSATLNIRIARTSVPLPPTFFIEIYDVGDLTLPDIEPTTLLPHFVGTRRLGSLRIDSAGFSDTALVRIPIDSAKLRTIIGDRTRGMRIGLQLRSTQSVEIRVYPSEDVARAPRLRYRVSRDTAVAAANILPSSSTPTTPEFTNTDFNDYVIVAAAPNLTARGTFAVGGMPGLRSYLRFDLPRWLTDSSAVLRARLELVQHPVRLLDDTTKVSIVPYMVLAGEAVTDLRRAALLLAPRGTFVNDSIRVAAADSGSRFLEINGLVRQWRTVNGVRNVPSALVLRSTAEGVSGFGARFFGLGAPAAVRPRLHISYVPSTSFTFGRP